MPSTPYALVRASINGGAATSGAITVPGSATVALTAESIVEWTAQRWEIYEYPTGFALPSGWTLDGTSGIMYSTSVTPSSFSLPSTATWGKWLIRLTVNNGIKNGASSSELVDEATALSMLSPGGLRDLAALETTQFSAQRGWAGDHKSNLRLLEALLAAPGMPALAGVAGAVLVEDPPGTLVFRRLTAADIDP